MPFVAYFFYNLCPSDNIVALHKKYILNYIIILLVENVVGING